jgi:S1-C subfamily serine protease
MKRMTTIRALLGACLAAAVVALIPGEPARADDVGAEVYQKGLKSVVWIVIKEPNGYRMGSGSVIDLHQKLVLTNYHVIAGKESALVTFPFYDEHKELVRERKLYFDRIKEKGAGIPAKVEFFDTHRDLAIIRLRNMPRDAQAVKLAERSPPTGSRVFSIGNPGVSDSQWVFTPGEVRSVYNKKWTAHGDELKFEVDARVIETTSPTNPGDSGGPLFNDKAEQVGVTQGGLFGAAVRDIAWFIDISEVKGVLKDHGIKLSDQPKEDKVLKTDDKGSVVENKGADAKDKADSKDKKQDKASNFDEKKAETEYAFAKSLADANRKDSAIRRLKDLIKNYPNTSAAKDAKELLDKLEGR